MMPVAQLALTIAAYQLNICLYWRRTSIWTSPLILTPHAFIVVLPLAGVSCDDYLSSTHRRTCSSG